MRVKEDRESEGLAIIAGIGVEETERASFLLTTLLRPKGSRLLSGALSRETCINFSHEKAKDMANYLPAQYSILGHSALVTGKTAWQFIRWEVVERQVKALNSII